MPSRPRKSPLVPIRLDRLQAAQQLDGRSWPEIASALGTTHQHIYHLTTEPGRGVLRRCRQALRDGLSALLEVPVDWLSGQTDALPYVLTADSTVVALPFSPEREVHARVSVLKGSGRVLPALQLGLDRLLASADAALARDEAQLAFASDGAVTRGYMRPYGLFLVAASVEVGLDLIRPMPSVEYLDVLRISAVRHAQQIYRPWFEGKGPYPDWGRIRMRILEQVPKDDRRTVLGLIDELGREDLLTAYAQLAAKQRKQRRGTVQGKGRSSIQGDKQEGSSP